MARRFLDLKLWAKTPYEEGSAEFWADVSLYNYVCDLYVQKMNGFRPPKTLQILLQSWNDERHHPWQVECNVGVSPKFNYNDFNNGDQRGKYLYVLNVIQEGMLELCEAFKWEKAIFESTYREVIAVDFALRVNFPSKLSRDRRTKAGLFIEKSPKTTSVSIELISDGTSSSIKLFDRPNRWSSDCLYDLCRFGKWFDKSTFGIYYNNGVIDVRYSLNDGSIIFSENGIPLKSIDFDKHFKIKSNQPYLPFSCKIR